MKEFDPSILKKLYVPHSSSHKGQNGKLLLIGGSKLFHAASLWSLKIASRIVDMVFYSSVPENNEIVKQAKMEFRDGIVVPRGKIKNYIEEADCILIGPGLPRVEGKEEGDDDTKELTEKYLRKYSHKKWVIDGGSLQVIEPGILPKNSIITPHEKEFEILFGSVIASNAKQSPGDPHVSRLRRLPQDDRVKSMAKKYNIVVVLKGERDVVCSPTECVVVAGGNAGMTKGGTGDVLSGLIAALFCKNDPFLAAAAGSYINKKAGEKLAQKFGLYYNASDLVDEIPLVLKELVR